MYSKLIKHVNKCAHCWKKNLITGIRFKQVILKGFLRLDLQLVQLIWQNNPPAFTTIIIRAGAGAGAAFFCTTHRGSYYSTSWYVYSVLEKVPEYRYPLYRNTGIRSKKVILKGFLRLDLQPVQPIWQNNPPAFTTII